MREVIRTTTRADRLLFVALLLLSLAGIFYTREAMPRGRDVIVEIDGRPAYTLPLDEDGALTLDGPEGPVIVEIRAGRARVREAHCRNQLCVKQGWLSGGAIVCLPNRIVVIVGGDGGGNRKGIDGVTG